MKIRTLIILVCVAATLLAVAVTWAQGGSAGRESGTAASGTPYVIHRQTVDGGSATDMVGMEYALSGTIGQPDAGVATGGAYRLFTAFWFPVPPGDAGEDGDVDLADWAAFKDCSTGPGVHDSIDGCRAFDVNRSGAVDLVDLAEIQVNFTGS